MNFFPSKSTDLRTDQQRAVGFFLSNRSIIFGLADGKPIKFTGTKTNRPLAKPVFRPLIFCWSVFPSVILKTNSPSDGKIRPPVFGRFLRSSCCVCQYVGSLGLRVISAFDRMVLKTRNSAQLQL